MLQFINTVQLILFLALMFLLGQAILFVLAGAKRESNPIYRLFQVISKPWMAVARWCAPKQVADQHVPFVAFFMISALYLIVLFWKIEHCVSINMAGCIK